MQIHALLGAGIRAKRLDLGMRQQDASRIFRSYGLPTWTPTAVGQVESGTRKPSIGELLLACAALGTSLADLVPDTDEPVDLGAGATMSATAVRALLSDDMDAFENEDVEPPGDEWLFEAARHARAAHALVEPEVTKILRSSPRRMTGADRLAAFTHPTEAETRAAERLGVEPAIMKAAARVLWGRDFEDERDARVGEVTDPGRLTVSALRGHASRAMIGELAIALGRDNPNALADPAGSEPSE
jgi:transcriptional regulator with XRE-family HTH domain